MLKYPGVTQLDNGSEFKGQVTKLLEEYNFEIQRATTKYKHTHTGFLEAFNKELEKLVFKRWMPKSFKTLKNIGNLGEKFAQGRE